MTDKKKDDNISKRIDALLEIYAGLPSEKMALAVPLIENAAFIENEMKKLQQTIAQNGVTDEYQNGANQFGHKQSATIQAYNALVKSYNTINARLEGMLPPKQKTKSKLEELIDE